MNEAQFCIAFEYKFEHVHFYMGFQWNAVYKYANAWNTHVQ